MAVTPCLPVRRFGFSQASASRNDQHTNSTISTTRTTDLKANAETRLTDVTQGN